MSLANQSKRLTQELTLAQIQDYMRIMAEHRGFTQEPPSATMLILLEEVGELAKALRKHSGLKIDQSRTSSYGNLTHEMADVLICLLILANKCNVNLFEALYEKEQLNSQRTWSINPTDKQL